MTFFYCHFIVCCQLLFRAKNIIGGAFRAFKSFFGQNLYSDFLWNCSKMTFFPSGGRAPVVRVAVGWLRSVPFGSVCLLVGQALEISCVYKARQTNTNLKTDWLIVEFLITKNHQIKTGQTTLADNYCLGLFHYSWCIHSKNRCCGCGWLSPAS